MEILNVTGIAILILQLGGCHTKSQVIYQRCATVEPSKEGTPGLQDHAVALPKQDQVFSSAQIKHEYL